MVSSKRQVTTSYIIIYYIRYKKPLRDLYDEVYVQHTGATPPYNQSQKNTIRGIHIIYLKCTTNICLNFW
jgi:hypothetical protein